MRTSLDIPDPIYREVKLCAAKEGRTVRQLLLDGIAMRLARRDGGRAERFKVPVIRSKRPGTLHLTAEQVDELTAFS